MLQRAQGKFQLLSEAVDAVAPKQRQIEPGGRAVSRILEFGARAR